MGKDGVRSGYVYATQDFKNMTESERDAATVRTGKIDATRVFEYLTGRQPTTDEINSVERALVEAGSLSRCHHDLLVVEFGENESTFGETVRSTDILTDYSVDTCTHKLDEVMLLIARKLLQQYSLARL